MSQPSQAEREHVNGFSELFIGVGLLVASPQIVVRRWDHKIEDLTDEGITPETVERIRAGNGHVLIV